MDQHDSCSRWLRSAGLKHEFRHVHKWRITVSIHLNNLVYEWIRRPVWHLAPGVYYDLWWQHREVRVGSPGFWECDGYRRFRLYHKCWQWNRFSYNTFRTRNCASDQSEHLGSQLHRCQRQPTHDEHQWTIFRHAVQYHAGFDG